MKFKKSVYNILIETRDDGKNLVFNTASGILSLMDEKTRNLYDEIENIDSGNLDSDSKERFDKLIQANYIVDKDIDEILMVKVRRQIQTRPNFGASCGSGFNRPRYVCLCFRKQICV